MWLMMGQLSIFWSTEACLVAEDRSSFNCLTRFLTWKNYAQSLRIKNPFLLKPFFFFPFFFLILIYYKWNWATSVMPFLGLEYFVLWLGQMWILVCIPIYSPTPNRKAWNTWKLINWETFWSSLILILLLLWVYKKYIWLEVLNKLASVCFINAAPKLKGIL